MTPNDSIPDAAIDPNATRNENSNHALATPATDCPDADVASPLISAQDTTLILK